MEYAFKYRKMFGLVDFLCAKFSSCPHLCSLSGVHLRSISHHDDTNLLNSSIFFGQLKYPIASYSPIIRWYCLSLGGVSFSSLGPADTIIAHQGGYWETYHPFLSSQFHTFLSAIILSFYHIRSSIEQYLAVSVMVSMGSNRWWVTGNNYGAY